MCECTACGRRTVKYNPRWDLLQCTACGDIPEDQTTEREFEVGTV